LAKAARLVIASGTAEAPVTVWYARNAGVGFGRYLKTLLKSLGYKPRLRSFSDEPAYHVMMRKMTASIPRTSLPQMAWSGWIPGYPSASDFIPPLFSCGAENNYTGFCDPPFEQKIKRTALEQTDLAAANRGWAKLDHELTDKAVWVPLYTVYGVDLVSKRVGHYQYNPQLGPLLSQMWVR